MSPVIKPDIECFLGKVVVDVVGREIVVLVEGGTGIVVVVVIIVVGGKVEVVVSLIVVVLVGSMVDVVVETTLQPEEYFNLLLSRKLSQFSMLMVKGRVGSKGEPGSCMPSASLISKLSSISLQINSSSSL
jgi:hypothetical protein